MRGVLVAVVAALAWVLADLTRIMPARYLAAALLMALLLGLICALAAMIGLRARRQVLDDAVPVGAASRIQLDLAPGAVAAWLPLGRGVVREHLPRALGGTGDLPLARAMPHRLRVTSRGGHELGRYSVIFRDVFGLFHLRRTLSDDARVTGLPVVGELTPQATAATGITPDGNMTATSHGVGEIGPIARPYASGDDIRRVHWRASARTGQLMTREEEPSAGQSAVIVLDTSRREEAPDVEDRLVSHAATVLESLGVNGWQVRIVDASGDEIIRTTPRRGVDGASPLGREADAVQSRSALLALAEVGFDDDPAASRHRTDHASGQTALAIALGVDDGSPFEGLQLDRFAGRATHRTAIALSAAPAGADPDRSAGTRPVAGGKGIGRLWTRRTGPGDGEDFGAPMRRARAEGGPGAEGAPGADADPVETPAPTRARLGRWPLVRGTTADDLADLLIAADGPVGPVGPGTSAGPGDSVGLGDPAGLGEPAGLGDSAGDTDTSVGPDAPVGTGDPAGRGRPGGGS